MIPPYAITDADGTVTQYVFAFADGTLPDGAVLVPERALANAQEAKWEAVKAKRQMVETGGASTPQGVIDSDTDSQLKVSGLVTMAMLAAQAGQAFSQAFTLADNTTVPLDGPAMIAVGLALGQHVSTCHGVAEGLRGQINAAATADDVNAIDIEGAAWPTPN